MLALPRVQQRQREQHQLTAPQRQAGEGEQQREADGEDELWEDLCCEMRALRVGDGSSRATSPDGRYRRSSEPEPCGGCSADTASGGYLRLTS